MQPSNVFSRCRMGINHWRLLHSCPRLLQTAADVSIPSDKITIPPSSVESTPVSPKIDKLVTEISQLNLIEVSELNTLLKKRLNLPDAPAMMFGGAKLAGMQQSAEEEEEQAQPQKVKTQFTVKLMKFDEKQKVALIKEVKNSLEGMNLVQAKKFVESAPVVVKADISKDEADKLKDVLSKVGAEIVVE